MSACVQELGRDFDRFVECRFLAVDQGVRIFLFRRVVQEPGRSEHTGLFRLVDSHLVVMQFNVVADAATERARGVLNYLKSHGISWGSRPVPAMATAASARANMAKIREVAICFASERGDSSGQQHVAGSLPVITTRRCTLSRLRARRSLYFLVLAIFFIRTGRGNGEGSP